ncbi:MAG TPA: acyl-CoA dehydrogenase, partial [Paracoccaceae bacterium]|nr:acyl-CoA dehydrogenase [Paracoccaceae bacterium]
AFALVLGGQAHLRAALADPARARLARVAILRLLPAHAGLLAEARAGAADLYALTDADLAA